MDSRRITQLMVIGLLVAATLSCVAPARAAKTFHGPVEASVVDVIDGDTFLADALLWPGQSLRINIRIRGIDAPEMKSRCRSEHAAALRARNALEKLLDGGSISISNIGGAKYYGRVLADVAAGDGTPVAEEMILRSLARPYRGGKRGGWCD
ncbi:nuclease [Mesorhizobium sp. Root157]|uniref:thermonuclease family protein n=1 Tax=Mesorhizobium sp. Root157 TaxID=1736477 RepID=UPI0006FDBCE7|nr:thermonuclease family protein [Mesorhizobium sp. Root157]KQZ91464.1 nuclease [Mesorhizobium sp. Root157]